MENKVIAEQDARKAVMSSLTPNIDYGVDNTEAQKVAVESALTVDGYVARVIVWLPTYVKIDWFKDNKPFTTYKSKASADVAASPLHFLSVMRGLSSDDPYVSPTSITVSPTTSSGAAASTVTPTVTVNPVGAPQTVTSSTSNAAVATVSGKTVTRVATGTATITFRSTTDPSVSGTIAITVT